MNDNRDLIVDLFLLFCAATVCLVICIATTYHITLKLTGPPPKRPDLKERRGRRLRVHVVVMQFTGKHWQRWGRRRTVDKTAAIVDHLPTEEIETGFEHNDRFVRAEAVGTLLEALFAKGVIDIDDLRAITGDDSLEVADPESA